MTNTLEVAILGFLLASTGGIFIALVMSYSKIIQNSVLPLAIILQVTPIVAIAPLIIIYVDNTKVALLLCVCLVAFLINHYVGYLVLQHNKYNFEAHTAQLLLFSSKPQKDTLNCA